MEMENPFPEGLCDLLKVRLFYAMMPFNLIKHFYHHDRTSKFRANATGFVLLYKKGRSY